MNEDQILPRTGLQRLVALTADAWLLPFSEEHLISRREPRYDPGWFHPSELSTPCDRKLAFSFLGVPKQESQSTGKQLRIYHNGEMVHRRWQAYFRSMGVLIKREAKFEISDPPVRGSADAIIHHPVRKDDLFIIEIKSINDNGFKKLKLPYPDHFNQLNIYMAGHKIYKGSVLYENKNTQDVKVFPVTYDQTKWEQLQIRLLKIIKKLQKVVMPEPFIHDGCTQCPYFVKCQDFNLNNYVEKHD